LDTVYNASNQELVRTKTVTKNTIVQIDATPFRHWYMKHYGVDLSKKKTGAAAAAAAAPVQETKQSGHLQAKLKARNATRVLEANIEEQFASGRLLACIASRPGQSGRADGYILEGEELSFYLRKLEKKKKQ
jgi:small subunit ribosomal protein S8e